MKNLLTYDEFLNENYLPYFGVKQALDDSVDNESGKPTTIRDFHRIYAMTTTWWNAWKAENKDKYEFVQDAFTKTYDVKDKKTGDLVFVYDYGRYKIFTNDSPSMFVLKNDVSPEELQKAEDNAENIDKTEKEKEEAEKIAKTKLPKKGAEGEEDSADDTGSDEEEADDEFTL
jgi:hypothetical protein